MTVSYGHAHPVVGVIAPIALASYIAAFGALFGRSHAWLAAARARLALERRARVDRARPPALVRALGLSVGDARLCAAREPGAARARVVHGRVRAVVRRARSAARRCSTRCRRARDARGRARAALAAFAGVARAARARARRAARAESTRARPRRGDPGQHRPGREVERGVDRGDARELRVALARGRAPTGAELIVWPETAVPGGLEVDPALRARVEALARETGAALRGRRRRARARRARPARPPTTTARSVFAPDGAAARPLRQDAPGAVRRVHPVPGLLGRILSAVARGIARSACEAGAAPRAIDDRAAGRPRNPRRHAGLLRAAVPRPRAPLRGGRRPRAARDHQRRLVRPHRRALSVPRDHGAALGRDRALDRARRQHGRLGASSTATGSVRDATPIFEPAWRVADVPLHPDAARGHLLRAPRRRVRLGVLGVLAIRALGARRRPRGRGWRADESMSSASAFQRPARTASGP